MNEEMKMNEEINTFQKQLLTLKELTGDEEHNLAADIAEDLTLTHAEVLHFKDSNYSCGIEKLINYVFEKFINSPIDTSKMKKIALLKYKMTKNDSIDNITKLLISISFEKYEDAIKKLLAHTDSFHSFYIGRRLMEVDAKFHKDFAFKLMSDAFKNKDNKNQHDQVETLLKIFGMRCYDTIKTFKSDIAYQHVEYAKNVSKYIKEEGLPLIIKALFAFRSGNITANEYYKRIFETLKPYDYSAHYEEIWDYFSKVTKKPVLQIVTNVFSKKEGILHFLQEEIAHENKNIRALTIQTLAQIDSDESREILKQRLSVESEKNLLELIEKSLTENNTESEVVNIPKNERYLFDVYAKNSVKNVIDEILENKETLSAEIKSLTFYQFEENLDFHEVEVTLANEETLSLEIEMDQNSQVPDYLDNDYPILEKFVNKYSLDEDQFTWGDSASLVCFLFDYVQESEFFTIPEKLRKLNLPVADDCKVIFASHDEDYEVNAKLIADTKSFTEKKLSNQFNDKVSLEEFAIICFEDKKMQKWMIKR